MKKVNIYTTRLPGRTTCSSWHEESIVGCNRSMEQMEHKLVIGDVKTCIISLGELYRNGWEIHSAGNDEMYLDGPTHQVPVMYERNSLAIQAGVLRITTN